MSDIAAIVKRIRAHVAEVKTGNIEDCLGPTHIMLRNEDALALADGISEAHKRQWINTDERKPKDGETVLGYWQGWTYSPAVMQSIQYKAADGDGKDAWIDAFDSDNDAPGWWLPLPPGPTLPGRPK